MAGFFRDDLSHAITLGAFLSFCVLVMACLTLYISIICLPVSRFFVVHKIFVMSNFHTVGGG